jgi:hypothetical protein
MRKLSILATVLDIAIAGAGPAIAGGGMGDPSAHQRQIQETCDKQRRGEIPGYPSGCPSWALPVDSRTSR